MELTMSKSVADYRLIFFQPEPESGERLCIALLFTEGTNRRTLIYDDRFARVRCFAPTFEAGLLRFLMKSLDEQLHDRDSDIDRILSGLGSQLSLSMQRRVAAPLNEKTKLQLLERFVLCKEHEEIGLAIAAESDKVQIEARFTEHLLNFARPLLSKENHRFIEHAGPAQVIGRKVPGIDDVSLLITIDGKATILDGVDLSIQTPKEVVRRTGKVAHTFWQYRNHPSDSVFQKQVNRVALIFNGMANPGAKYKDAQEFARTIFERESELIIEHDNAEDLSRLESLILR
jgi:hypothetical protein